MLTHGIGWILRNLAMYVEAIKSYDKAIEINPNFPNAWNSKGVILGDLKKYAEAIKSYDEAIRINPNYADAWYNKGVTLGNLGKYDEEIKSYDEAIRINPNYIDAWHNKGIVLGNLGKHNEAIKSYDEAIKINPNYAEAWYNKGWTLGNLRKYDVALSNLEKAEALFLQKGLRIDADKSRNLILLAKNVSDLMVQLKPLDEKFRKLLNSQSLNELKEKSLGISKGIDNVIKDFEKREIPEEAKELLFNKEICFTALVKSLKFEQVDLKKLEETKAVFEKWGFDEFVIAVNSLDSFIHLLSKYKSLDEILRKEEKRLLLMLSSSLSILDGILSEKISDKFKT